LFSAGPVKLIVRFQWKDHSSVLHPRGKRPGTKHCWHQTPVSGFNRIERSGNPRQPCIRGWPGSGRMADVQQINYITGLQPTPGLSLVCGAPYPGRHPGYWKSTPQVSEKGSRKLILKV